MYYKLDDNRKVIESDRSNFGHEIVQRTILPDGVWISTVFIGLDMASGHSPAPVVFETMIFSADNDGELYRRYSTWEEAVAGHAAACKSVEGG